MPRAATRPQSRSTVRFEECNPIKSTGKFQTHKQDREHLLRCNDLEFDGHLMCQHLRECLSVLTGTRN